MLRFLGWMVLLPGLGALALAIWTLLGAMLGGTDPWIATGLWWFQTHPDSLQLLQPAIERHVSVWLFEDVVQPLLESPLVVVAGVGGLVFLIPARMLRRTA